MRTPTPTPTRTRLMIAAYHGRVDDIEKYLKQAGRQDYRHLTALMYAIIAGHTECVRLLAPLEAHIQMPDGWTAFDEARRQNNEELVRILAKYDVGNTGLLDTSERSSHATSVSSQPPQVQQSGSHYLQDEASPSRPLKGPHATPVDRGQRYARYNPLTSEESSDNSLYQQNPMAVTTSPYPKKNGDRMDISPNGRVKWEGRTQAPHAETDMGSANYHDRSETRKGRMDQAKEDLSPHICPEGEKQRNKARIDQFSAGVRPHQELSSSFKSTRTEAEQNPLQANQEINLLKQQLQKANEETKKYREMYETLNWRAREAEKSLAEAMGEVSSLKARLTKTNKGSEVSQGCSAVSGNKLSSQPTATGSLILAAAQGNVEGVRANLHEIGKQGENGWTALMYAARGGYTNCIPLLKREAGIQDNYGWTALMWPAYYGKTDCVRLLLSEAGKQTTKEYNDFPPGTTALMMAAHYNYPKIVELLLPYEQGLKDSKGHTAKWYANNSSYGGDYSQVRTLLKDEGTERIPPPSNPAEMLRFQERINELATENDSLQKDFPFSKNAHEKTKNELSQSNREVSSLKQQLQKANKENDILHKQLEDKERRDKAQINRLTAEIESLKQQLDNAINESKRHAKMCEDLQKASDQKQVFIDQLVKEAASLRQTMVQQNTYLTTFLIEVLKTHGTQEPRNRGPMPAGSLPEPAVKREA
ncbi:Ankyrin repeat protein 3 [Giardia muris]|uniref:Ankyrin repeat protein 3 n=1 Tax=Giardia muris TaxID=5742 RepID=A0A4Z1SRP8_GIAMU|nr:Ankyrin repeat protein 3 [Giardia muris]|eukprot:TNJ27655.1 Ankyrin repeat protein 3 [Giardia muris]